MHSRNRRRVICGVVHETSFRCHHLDAAGPCPYYRTVLHMQIRPDFADDSCKWPAAAVQWSARETAWCQDLSHAFSNIFAGLDNESTVFGLLRRSRSELRQHLIANMRTAATLRHLSFHAHFVPRVVPGQCFFALMPATSVIDLKRSDLQYYPWSSLHMCSGHYVVSSIVAVLTREACLFATTNTGHDITTRKPGPAFRPASGGIEQSRLPSRCHKQIDDCHISHEERHVYPGCTGCGLHARFDVVPVPEIGLGAATIIRNVSAPPKRRIPRTT
jgi:hypothetical protein